MLTVIILSAILLILALLALSVRLLFNKKAEFRGGGCNASSPELEKRGVSCGCGGMCSD